MRMTKRRIRRTRFLYSNMLIVDSMSKSQLAEELSEYGVLIAQYCTLDKEMLKSFLKSIINDVIDKYGRYHTEE